MLRERLLLDRAAQTGIQAKSKCQEKKTGEQRPCGAHFGAQIDRSSGVLCTQTTGVVCNGWGCPTPTRDVPLRSAVDVTVPVRVCQALAVSIRLFAYG